MTDKEVITDLTKENNEIHKEIDQLKKENTHISKENCRFHGRIDQLEDYIKKIREAVDSNPLRIH